LPTFRAGLETTIQKSFIMTNIFLFLGNLNMTELLVILGVVLLLFGGKKIPELMRGVGKGIREFNNARNSIEEEIKEGMKAEDKKKIEEKKAAE
jgi:sec-independent protein translocase protein TatA